MLHGIPPFPVNVQKSPGEQAFAEVRAALKAETAEAPVVFMMESKKLCLGIVEAYELLANHRRRSLDCDQGAILRQELQHQVMAFALMRVITDDEIKAAAIRSSEKFHEGANATPPVTKAGLLVREMESVIDQDPETEEAIKAALVSQPLFRVLSQTPEVFTNLEQHYPEIALNVPNLVAGTNESLVQLMQMQSGGYRPTQPQTPPPAAT